MTPSELLGRLFRGVSDGDRRLAEILGVEPGELASIRMRSRYNYRPRSIAKPKGGERRLLVPSPSLKAMQRRLLDQYLSTLAVHASATAFRARTSAVRNAKAHARRTLVATLDLRDFFESTNANRVRAFFRRQGWAGEALGALMRLCVFRDGLPQGAPTSPCLSNLVNLPLDDRLSRLALRHRATYTRYGDDLTFSWDADAVPGGFRAEVEDVIAWAGYEASPGKGWRVTPIAGRPVVTGVVLRGRGRIGTPWAIRRKVWLLRLKRLFSSDESLPARLEGYRSYLRSLKSLRRLG